MDIHDLAPEAEILAELGRRLATVRKQQGLSQETFAAHAGVGVATVRRIEGGDSAHMETWIKIMKALGMIHSVDMFLPANFKSPMAEAKAARRRKVGKETPSGVAWGDEA